MVSFLRKKILNSLLKILKKIRIISIISNCIGISNNSISISISIISISISFFFFQYHYYYYYYNYYFYKKKNFF